MRFLLHKPSSDMSSIIEKVIGFWFSVVWYVESSAIEMAQGLQRELNGEVFLELCLGGTKGWVPIVWNKFISSPQIHNLEIKNCPSTDFNLMVWRWKMINGQERKGTHCGLLRCCHVWAWRTPTAYLNYAFPSFLLTRIIHIYWCYTTT